MSSVLKVAALAAAVAFLPSGPGASAKVMKRSTGACTFHRKVVASGTLCSFDCDPKSLWCSQQVCTDGHWSAFVGCQSIFCVTPKCG
jgi:hypothetical protein